MSDRRKLGKGCKGEVLAGGCGGVPLAPFSWPREGGQVEDYARRGDEVEQLVDWHRWVGNHPFTADRGPEWRLDLSSSRAWRRDIHPKLNCYKLSIS